MTSPSKIVYQWFCSIIQAFIFYAFLISYSVLLSGISPLYASTDIQHSEIAVAKHFTTDPETTENGILKIASDFIEAGRHEQAFDLLHESSEELTNPGFAFASLYLDLAATLMIKEHFDKATTLYYSSLAKDHFSPADSTEMLRERDYLLLIIDSEQADELNRDYNNKLYKLANEIKKSWLRLNPTHISSVNHRLIEHRIRLNKALKTYRNEDDRLLLDARGKLFVRFGPPDKIYAKKLEISELDLHTFTTEYLSSIEESNGINVSRSAKLLTNKLMRAISTNPFATTLKVWVYFKFNDDAKRNAVFYFTEQKNNIFQSIRSLDDWIPRGLYSQALTSIYGLPFPPSLAIQYIAYHELWHVDPQIMDLYDDLNFEIFNSSLRRSPSLIKILSSRLKEENRYNTELNQGTVPAESSSELEKIHTIPLLAFQYKALNKEGKPVFTTFIESKPAYPFLSDYVENQKAMSISKHNIEENYQAIQKWYKLEQGVELYNSDMESRGRIRDYPSLELSSSKNVSTYMLTDIPFIEPGAMQSFYVTLVNNHPEIENSEETIFQKNLRALGRLAIPQENHLDVKDREVAVSDLIIGYNRINLDEVRFPFIVSHERKIPSGQNPVIHFEVYQLQPDSTGFSRFEIEYRFEPEKKPFRFFGSKSKELGGTIEFSTKDRWFRESLEFDEMNLSTGNYKLFWKTTDLVSGSTQEKEIEIVVTDENQYQTVEN